jgi:hypothetical protein
MAEELSVDAAAEIGVCPAALAEIDQVPPPAAMTALNLNAAL